MKSAGTSSALTAALGLSVRKGSMSTRVPSLSRSKAACPSQRTRVAIVVVLHRNQGLRFIVSVPPGQAVQVLPGAEEQFAVGGRQGSVGRFADVIGSDPLE